VISALPTLLATGSAAVNAGLLAVDEVFSPVQMALDHELAGALDRFTCEYEVSDAAIGADVVAAAGPGGSFMAEPHTAAWLRRELWQPSLWERQGFSAWLRGDGHTDIDRAKAQVLEILATEPAPSAVGDDEARQLQGIIDKASSIRHHR
jgi:trimethylamine--corrinoid protein Co-methyltransferase